MPAKAGKRTNMTDNFALAAVIRWLEENGTERLPWEVA